MGAGAVSGQVRVGWEVVTGGEQGSAGAENDVGLLTQGDLMPGSVIVSSARTPIGKLSGGFASLSATDLGGRAIAAALERAGLPGDKVNAVIMGQVLQAGAGQITARQAAFAG